jgi:hypothetical protein
MGPFTLDSNRQGLEMAQIIRLRSKSNNIKGTETPSQESVLLAALDRPAAEIVSAGTGLMPWVETLQDCLANLDSVAGGFAEHSQERFRDEVRLLSDKLALAADKLDQKLRDLNDRHFE